MSVDYFEKMHIIKNRKEDEVAIMLIQFNFKNFRSFREEVTLDLSATKMTEFSERVVTIGSEKILPVAAIYGANASGKSNIYSAFEYMAEYVVDSFKYGDEEEKFEEYRPTPFLFDSTSADAESSFEVYFTIPGDKNERTYNYGFCVDQEGVTEEWLNSKAKTARKYSTVFYRGNSDNELDLSGLPKNSRDNIKIALEKQVLIASLGAKLKISKCKAIRDWFLINEFADFGDPVTNFFLSRRLPRGFVDDKNVQQKVVEYFASFDEHIKDFRVEKVPSDGESKEEKYKINALHKKIDSDEMAEIPLGAESAGTLKMFALYPELQEVLEKGSVFFIDELNARLHPLLVRNFLLIFLNPNININHAQLVFTTHDTWQLSNQLLRRDEIWFVEKDDRGVSTLYSLADFVDEDGARIRKDESYEKNYLIGKYGAIPTLSAAACGFHKNAYKVGSVGIPFLNTIIRITNIETLEEQSYNEQGEIWISSPTAMLGYDNNEEETKRVVYTDANGVKWIRSGDIGHMDEQGFLYIDGRIKRIIIRHDGFKVFPTQIENVIATCPEVKTCCAIGRADKDHSQGKLPVVYITLSREKKDKMKLKEELNSLCKQMLPEYMQPIDFVFIDKMPLTANGKVDFHELEGIELSNRL